MVGSSSLLRSRFGESSKSVENPHSDADLDLRGSIFRRIRVLPHNSPMTRRAPPALHPPVLKSNTVTGANRRPQRPGSKRDVSTRLVGFLAILLLLLDRNNFFE